jgi:methionyl-tRNA formyltransferase
VAPPFPGALTTIAGRPARVLRTRVADPSTAGSTPPMLCAADDGLLAQCGGGGTLAIVALEIEGALVTPAAVRARFGAAIALPAAGS